MGSFNPSNVSFPHVMIIVLVLALPHLSLSIDVDSAKEGPCIKIDNTTGVDLSWVLSVKSWYFPALSRGELYRGSTALLEKDPKDIPEDFVYYRGCVTATFDLKNYTVSGFGGEHLDLRMNPKRDLSEVDLLPLDNDEKWVTCFTTLTDNKLFLFNACCYNDNQRTWIVSSRKKTLPEETLKQIHDHAETLGFKREQFTGLEYNHCGHGGYHHNNFWLA